MNIELHEIPVREIIAGYIDDAENGVRGYNGRLNIRPAFQREFIYKDKQRDEVIYTVRKNFPLNVMYWVKSDGGNFEVLDGQQRTISICQYVTNCFSVMIDGMLGTDIASCGLSWLSDGALGTLSLLLRCVAAGLRCRGGYRQLLNNACCRHLLRRLSGRCEWWLMFGYVIHYRCILWRIQFGCE